MTENKAYQEALEWLDTSGGTDPENGSFFPFKDLYPEVFATLKSALTARQVDVEKLKIEVFENVVERNLSTLCKDYSGIECANLVIDHLQAQGYLSQPICISKTAESGEQTDLSITDERLNTDQVREALKFYADERNYDITIKGSMEFTATQYPDHVLYERGKRARAALASQSIQDKVCGCRWEGRQKVYCKKHLPQPLEKGDK